MLLDRNKMKNGDLLSEFSKQLSLLTELDGADIHIALSGGLDSVVLLHLFSRLQSTADNFQLSAHHINHGLSDNATHWADFCLSLASQLKIKFHCSTVILNKQTRTSLEALAREKRYGCLKEKLSENSLLVTGHHQDDQLETILLALKRGAGITGLQGILPKQKLTKGQLIRPLLDFSRKELEEYADFFELHWIEDESNNDQVFDRNFIRHTISPLLKKRWPSISKTAARSASLCQEQQLLVDEIALLDFKQVSVRLLNEQLLNISELKKLSKTRRSNLLRYWFKKHSVDYPSAKQLAVIYNEIALADKDALPKIQLKEITVRRYRDNLYIVKDKIETVFPDQPVSWSGESQMSLLGGVLLLNFKLGSQGIAVNSKAIVEICFRCHLSKQLTCTPVGRSGSRTIKKLLHEYHVAPWLRDFIPFLFIDGEFRSALGLWECAPLVEQTADHYLTVSFA